MFDDRSPIYRQIAEQIRDQVLRGELEEDEQVMSTTQYATFYRINPATAAKAFQELEDDGILYKRRGLGTFVSPGARERLRDEHRRRFFTDVVDPMIEEAVTIGIGLDEVIEHVRGRQASDHEGTAREESTR